MSPSYGERSRSAGAGAASSGSGGAWTYAITLGNWTDDKAQAIANGISIPSVTNFGASVALSDAYLLIGAPKGANGGGDVYLYNLLGTSWSDLTRASAAPSITLSSGDSFGSSVALYGSLALFGAPGVASGRGDAYLYNIANGTWTDLATTSNQLVTALPAGSAFGSAVGLSSGYAVIGAPGVASGRGACSSNCGSV